MTTDDKKSGHADLALYADGVNEHALLMPRADSIRNSFNHSFIDKGRLLYAHDETLAGLCSRLHVIGDRHQVDIGLLPDRARIKAC